MYLYLKIILLHSSVILKIFYTMILITRNDYKKHYNKYLQEVKHNNIQLNIAVKYNSETNKLIRIQ